MTDCVLHAYEAHRAWTDGYRAEGYSAQLTRSAFRAMQFVFRGAGRSPASPIHGSVAPFVVRMLAAIDGFQIRAEHALLTPAHHKSAASTRIQRWAVDIATCQGWFGKEVAFSGDSGHFSLVPAIYLVLGTQHAEFTDRVPPGVPVMAFQLYVRGRIPTDDLLDRYIGSRGRAWYEGNKNRNNIGRRC